MLLITFHVKNHLKSNEMNDIGYTLLSEEAAVAFPSVPS